MTSGKASKGAPPRFKEARVTYQFGPILREVCSLLETTHGLCVSLSSCPQSCRDGGQAPQLSMCLHVLPLAWEEARPNEGKLKFRD